MAHQDASDQAIGAEQAVEAAKVHTAWLDYLNTIGAQPGQETTPPILSPITPKRKRHDL